MKLFFVMVDFHNKKNRLCLTIDITLMLQDKLNKISLIIPEIF